MQWLAQRLVVKVGGIVLEKHGKKELISLGLMWRKREKMRAFFFFFLPMSKYCAVLGLSRPKKVQNYLMP